MLKNIISAYFSNKKITNITFYLAAIISAVVFIINIYFLYQGIQVDNPDPASVLGSLVISLISILVLCVLVVSNTLLGSLNFIRKKAIRISKLRKRIIVAFSTGVAIPTIIITVFSTYFFNLGIEAWFDKKISNVLDQSISVGESYIDEHILQLKKTAISVSDDLSSMYYDLIHSPELFSRVINAQAELRFFDEAIVFQKSSNTILAQTSLSFSLAFMTIPTYLIEKADKGGVVEVQNDLSKIRILIKLKDYNDTYLLIGRLIDQKIIDHINKTTGSAQEYKFLKSKIVNMQIKFSMVFIVVTLILVIAAIIWGTNFAEKIVKPIRELVIAAEKVKNGDFTAQVPLENLKKDEIKVLSSSFNRMVNQIDRQHKELVVAQRALAWSDVARRVAHEIKNPLTPIQLSADRLLKKFKSEVSDQESFVKYIKNILKYSDDIKQIVSEFVEFARLPAPNFSKCEIISLINDLVESRKLVNDRIRYSFVSNLKEYEFVCDISQINRVMENIILNSEEAFQDDQDDKTIKVSIYITNGNLQIIIEDNGPGFSEKILKVAKDAYVTTKTNGTGLGLSIVDRIVTDHFGKILIFNLNSRGAKIELIFDADKLKNKLK